MFNICSETFKEQQSKNNSRHTDPKVCKKQNSFPLIVLLKILNARFVFIVCTKGTGCYVSATKILLCFRVISISNTDMYLLSQFGGTCIFLVNTLPGNSFFLKPNRQSSFICIRGPIGCDSRNLIYTLFSRI